MGQSAGCSHIDDVCRRGCQAEGKALATGMCQTVNQHTGMFQTLHSPEQPACGVRIVTLQPYTFFEKAGSVSPLRNWGEGLA